MLRQLRAERAFTLIEMMIVVVVVAILTALALPDEGSSAALEGKLAAESSTAMWPIAEVARSSARMIP